MNKLFSTANKRVSFGGAATLLIATALVGQILGFLRNRLVSTNFTSIDPGSSDAFFAAFQIPDFFYYTIAAGALGVAFMPFIADKIAANDKKGVWNLTNGLLNVMAVAMGIVSIFLFVFARPLIHTLAPNLPEDHLREAVTIMRIISFNPLLFSISGILTSLQQSFGRFFFYATAPLIYNTCIIASIFLFRNNIGIVGLGIGALVGAVLQLSFVTMGLFGLGYSYRPKIHWRQHGFRDMLRQIPARSLDQGIDQINSVVETNRAQTLGVGSVSYYNFATTLHNVPIMLIGTSIATAAFPRLVERLAQNRKDLFHKEFGEILRMMLWVSVPVLVLGYFCRGYLARLIFGDVSREVALIFGFLTMAILFRIIYSMFSRWFYAQKDTKTPLYVSIFAIALNIFLAFNLSRESSYGITGLALAQSFVAMAEVVVLGVIMLIRDKQVFNKDLMSGVGKLVSVTGFTTTTAYIMASLLPLNRDDVGFVTLVSKLTIIAIASFSVHLVVSAMLDMREAKIVFARAKQIILKPIRIQ